VTALDEPTRPWSGPWPTGTGTGDATPPWPGDDCMDVVVFPDMLRFRLVTLAQLPAFAQCLAALPTLRDPDTPLPTHPFLGAVPWARIDGFYVLVCVHRSRDRRCGVAGPLLLDALDEARHTLGLTETVHLAGTSHIGGHKFAGTHAPCSSASERSAC
jgi:hypothetical protein